MCFGMSPNDRWIDINLDSSVKQMNRGVDLSHMTAAEGTSVEERCEAVRSCCLYSSISFTHHQLRTQVERLGPNSDCVSSQTSCPGTSDHHHGHLFCSFTALPRLRSYLFCVKRFPLCLMKRPPHRHSNLLGLLPHVYERSDPNTSHGQVLDTRTRVSKTQT